MSSFLRERRGGFLIVVKYEDKETDKLDDLEICKSVYTAQRSNM